MNVIIKVLQERFKNNEAENRNLPSSPTKTVLGALTPRSVSREPIIPKIGMACHKKGIYIAAPKHIEDIPFRRQDKRILNARKKRIVDRKLIILLNIMGFFILILGLTLFGLFFAFNQDYKRTKVFVVLGPVLAAIGFVVMMFSIEVCARLMHSIKRERDPEVDDIENVHHIKHWIHPELIPFGWGHRDNIIESSFNEGDEITLPFKESSEALQGGSNKTDVNDDSHKYSKIDIPELAIVPSSPAHQIRADMNESTLILMKENI